MIAKFITATTLFAVAFAGGLYPPGTETTNSCNVGQQYCCNSLQKSDSAEALKALGLANVALGPVAALVGVSCNPISVIGANANACNAQPACCTGNNFNGAAVVGCTPIAATA